MPTQSWVIGAWIRSAAKTCCASSLRFGPASRKWHESSGNGSVQCSLGHKRMVHVEHNAAGQGIDGALSAMPAVKSHFRSLPYQEVATALANRRGVWGVTGDEVGVSVPSVDCGALR